MAMSHENLRTLLTDLADEVSQVPQREYSGAAWGRARRIGRRRVVLGTAAAVVLAAVPVALLLPRNDAPVRPAERYSEAPLRARAAHTATLLADGRVLVVGGCASDGCTTAEGAPESEYYVPGRGFTAGPDLVQPRQGHSATLLADGRVLIVGGWAREGTPPLDSAEVYDPRTGRFEPVGPLAVGRGGATGTVLPDGRVLVAGGQVAAGGSTATAELFDPGRDVFTPAAPMPQARDAAVATVLPDGRVLVVGGQESTGNALASAVLYDPGSDTWRPTGNLGTPRDKLALAPLPDGRVLVLGGSRDDRDLLRTTEIYDPGTGAFGPGPTMDIERYKFVVTSDAAGRIVVAGGTQLAVYDAGRFHPVAGTTGPIRWTPTVTGLPDGDILVIGGYDDRIRLYDDARLISVRQITDAVG
jgi:hypothetical protein